MLLSHAELKRLLHYDPETGIWTRLIQTASNAKVGDCAGSRDSLGYWQLSINNKTYRSHRLAWFYMTSEWPSHEIDHKNMIRHDNRWENLRAATASQNHANRKLASLNTSGLKGVSWHKHTRKWRATIKCRQKTRHLGIFDCPAAAHFIYLIEASKKFGEFARAK